MIERLLTLLNGDSFCRRGAGRDDLFSQIDLATLNQRTAMVKRVCWSRMRMPVREALKRGVQRT